MVPIDFSKKVIILIASCHKNRIGKNNLYEHEKYLLKWPSLEGGRPND